MTSITTPELSLQKLQSKLKDHIKSSKDNISLVDELIKIRRKESKNDDNIIKIET